MSQTTQVAFTTNAQLKNQTMKKLKDEGVTLKTLLQYAMKAYLQGKISLGITINTQEEWNASLEGEYQEKMKDFNSGNNIVERDDFVNRKSHV